MTDDTPPAPAGFVATINPRGEVEDLRILTAMADSIARMFERKEFLAELKERQRFARRLKRNQKRELASE